MRILIIAAFFPPLNNIASSRISAFKKYLEQEGCAVDVITRFYDKSQIDGKNLLVSSQEAKYMLSPFIEERGVFYTNYNKANFKYKLFNLLPPGLKGVYAYYNIDIYHYGWLKYILSVFETKLKDTKYDCIIGSYGPATSFQAASIISKRYNIPWFADYRDLYIDFRVSPIHLLLKQVNQYRLLSSAKGIFFVSPGMRDFYKKFAIGKLRKIPFQIVYNGFDNESYNNTFDREDEKVVRDFYKIKEKYSIILLHSGSLYKGRNIDFFLRAVEKYNGQSERKACIGLLGLSNNNFNQQLSGDCIVLPRVSVNTSFYLQKQADALLMPIFYDLYTGFSGKVFEYLYTDNIVFTAPNPHQDLLDLIESYSNVKVMESEASFIESLNQLAKGEITKYCSLSKEHLTRGHAVKKMLRFIRNTLQIS